MAAEPLFDLGPSTSGHRLQVGHGLAPAHDGEVLPSVLDGIQQVSEVAGRIRCADIGHRIRLSDPRWTLPNEPTTRPERLPWRVAESNRSTASARRRRVPKAGIDGDL